MEEKPEVLALPARVRDVPAVSDRTSTPETLLKVSLMAAGVLMARTSPEAEPPRIELIFSASRLDTTNEVLAVELPSNVCPPRSPTFADESRVTGPCMSRRSMVDPTIPVTTSVMPAACATAPNFAEIGDLGSLRTSASTPCTPAN
jgi:hypothetical protein